GDGRADEDERERGHDGAADDGEARARGGGLGLVRALIEYELLAVADARALRAQRGDVLVAGERRGVEQQRFQSLLTPALDQLLQRGDLGVDDGAHSAQRLALL